jgi:hypothetical protein
MLISKNHIDVKYREIVNAIANLTSNVEAVVSCPTRMRDAEGTLRNLCETLDSINKANSVISQYPSADETADLWSEVENAIPFPKEI